MDIEYRAARTIELRKQSEDPAARLSLAGYASTFDTPYEVDGMVETISRSAFDATLRSKPDVFALISHDPGRPIARTTNGSLTLGVDEHGLRVIINPIDTQEGRDAVTLVETGTLDSMSFGFIVKDDAIELRGGRMHREIRDLELHEVSIVAFPANPTARIATRSKQRAETLLMQETAKQNAITLRRFLVVPPLANLKGRTNGTV
jgi:HK97 family phage prohead protease